MSTEAKPTHFITIDGHDARFLTGVIERAIVDKGLFRAGKLPRTLEGKTLAMYFQKPSLRTRLSFEVGMAQLGGQAVYLTDADIGLGKREPVKDIARVISGMCEGIMARTFSHQVVEELALYAYVPVINALSDYSHPCQAMADAMTIMEHHGRLAGVKIVFIGDGNNVARSLASLAAILDLRFTLAAPQQYHLADDFVKHARGLGPGTIAQTTDPIQAVKDADVIYTDTWISMGQEEQRQQRIADFRGYQVNDELLKHAPAHAIVMHCLPAYRGFEITDQVIESPRSVVFQQSENRLHLQRTLMAILLGQRPGGHPACRDATAEKPTN